jgi:hypothetical protein
MTISDFQTTTDACGISWRFDGQVVRKNYGRPVHAVLLNDCAGVLVVEPTNLPSNAVIYNGDGTPRVRIMNPLRFRGAVCFSECGYEADKLKLIVRTAGSEYACTIDALGQTTELHEVR